MRVGGKANAGQIALGLLHALLPLGLLLTAWLWTGCAASGRTAADSLPAPAAAVTGAPAPTATPFLPVSPTPTALPTLGPVPSVTPLLPSPTPAPSFDWQGVDFARPDCVIRVELARDGAGDIPIAFSTGWPCAYSDHRACASLHRGGRALLVDVHSGIGGEGEPLRRAMEGMGLNRAAYSLARVSENLASLSGAAVTVTQEGLSEPVSASVLAAVRVPAAEVGQHFALPVDDALDRAAESSPALRAALDSGRKLLIIETCGWKHPEEPWADGVSATTGSVYLLAIGE